MHVDGAADYLARLKQLEEVRFDGRGSGLVLLISCVERRCQWTLIARPVIAPRNTYVVRALLPAVNPECASPLSTINCINAPGFPKYIAMLRSYWF